MRGDDDLAQIEALAEWQARRSYDPTRGVPLAAWVNARRRFARLDELRRRRGRGRGRPVLLALDAIPPPGVASPLPEDPGPWHRRLVQGQVRWVRFALCAACHEPYWQRRDPKPRRFCSLACAGIVRRKYRSCQVCRKRPTTFRRRNCTQCRGRRGSPAQVRCRWCGATFACFLIEKMRTMTMKGGNATELYKGDGRLRMARSLERVWPYVVTTGRRFKRPQHVVRDNWLRFDTPLKLKPGIDLAKLPQNDYGLQLVQVGDTINSPALRKLVTGDGQAAGESVAVRASSADHPPGD